jgi:MHS family proline/betaine transporter-like MFS transporter
MPAFYAVVTAIGTLLAVLTITDRSQEPLRDF